MSKKVVAKALMGIDDYALMTKVWKGEITVEELHQYFSENILRFLKIISNGLMMERTVEIYNKIMNIDDIKQNADDALLLKITDDFKYNVKEILTNIVETLKFYSRAVDPYYEDARDDIESATGIKVINMFEFSVKRANILLLNNDATMIYRLLLKSDGKNYQLIVGKLKVDDFLINPNVAPILVKHPYSDMYVSPF